MRLSTTWVGVCAGLLAACGGGSGDGDPDAGGAVEGGPTVELTADRTTLTEGEIVTFTAVVVDPDGAADVAGGELQSGDGVLSFGAFSPAGPETWSFSLSWNELHALQPIELDGDEARQFRAEFVDQTDRRGFATVTITLTCAGGMACDGSCACGPSLGACFEDGDFTTCADACADAGATCVEAGCDGSTVHYYELVGDCEVMAAPSPAAIACDAALADADSARCCCGP